MKNSEGPRTTSDGEILQRLTISLVLIIYVLVFLKVVFW
jgi:hypothetical protein